MGDGGRGLGHCIKIFMIIILLSYYDLILQIEP